jgi:hypothetical protein
MGSILSVNLIHRQACVLQPTISLSSYRRVRWHASRRSRSILAGDRAASSQGIAQHTRELKTSAGYPILVLFWLFSLRISTNSYTTLIFNPGLNHYNFY